MAQLISVRLVGALVQLGWTVDRQSGSHAVLTKLGRSPVTIPVHEGRTLKEGTARAILEQARISETALFDLYWT